MYEKTQKATVLYESRS